MRRSDDPHCLRARAHLYRHCRVSLIGRCLRGHGARHGEAILHAVAALVQSGFTPCGSAMLLHNRRHSSHQWLSMNELFVTLGIETWKPVLGNLLLPPVPLLLLVLVGTRMIVWRRAVGWSVVLLSVLGQWLGACSASGEWLQRQLLSPLPPLGVERIAELRRAASGPRPTVAIVVLGGGRESLAPEYRDRKSVV